MPRPPRTGCGSGAVTIPFLTAHAAAFPTNSGVATRLVYDTVNTYGPAGVFSASAGKDQLNLLTNGIFVVHFMVNVPSTNQAAVISVQPHGLATLQPGAGVGYQSNPSQNQNWMQFGGVPYRVSGGGAPPVQWFTVDLTQSSGGMTNWVDAYFTIARLSGDPGT